jgi:hypothetical protein
LEDLTQQITEYRERTQKKVATAQELNVQKLAKRKAIVLA